MHYTICIVYAPPYDGRKLLGNNNFNRLLNTLNRQEVNAVRQVFQRNAVQAWRDVALYRHTTQNIEQTIGSWKPLILHIE